MNSRTIFIAPYRLARAPLTVLDATLAQRLPKDSAPRMTFDRVLGSFDQFAGRLLANDTIAQQGASRIARITKLAMATTLDQEAAENRTAAQAVATRGEQQAAQKAEQAKDRARDGAAQAEQAERDGKRQAAVRARTLAAQKKKQAEARKQQQVEAAEQRVEQAESVANARTTTARRAAQAKLGDASQTRAAAAANRADADQLGDLTAGKRQARKQT